MNIGLDIHGVIDAQPKFFAKLTKLLAEEGHQIHIVTGQKWDNVKNELDAHGITYHHHYSIVDHHLNVGTKMWSDDKRGDGWWMSKEDWIRSKGDYARNASLDIHIDDETSYAPYFPDSCRFVLFLDDMDAISKIFPKR